MCCEGCSLDSSVPPSSLFSLSYCRYAKVEAEIAADIGKRDPKHISHCCYLYRHFLSLILRTDEFEFSGHYCMVMPILGKSLYDVLKENDYRPFPMSYIRPILRHVGIDLHHN